ncbi:MAG: nucleotidyltransferase domain-containing protein [Rhodocyclaceae bacterium]|nr:nucleotidyltransferase domain-containing protein [Rhodocyclaceae bacterium]
MLAPYAARLILFGSRARGDAHGTSDIDIAVAAKVPIPRHVLATARECLEIRNTVSRRPGGAGTRRSGPGGGDRPGRDPWDA